jgi:transposase
MMGTKVQVFTPISALSLDALVPNDHFYRHLNQVLDLSFLRDLVVEHYAAGVGRPSIDPVVFFKLQLEMFCEGIRSERQLLRLAADRLSVRWYLGYNLNEPLPDHSSLTRIRARYGLEIFHRFFDAIVEQCQQAGLVWGKELYFDATHVLADAALESLVPRFAVEAQETLQTHLAALFPEESGQDEQVDAVELAGAPSEPLAPAHDGDPAGQSTSLPPTSPPTSLPIDLPDLLRDELAEVNATRHDWIAQDGRQHRAVHGVYQRVADFRISTTDPDATPLRLKGGGTHLGYQTHYVVDGGKRRIILGVLVAPSEVMENQPVLVLLWHVRFRWKLQPRQVTGDITYGTIENILALEDIGIRAYVPLPDWDHMTAYFGASHFPYDAAQDVYRCPRGQLLRPYRRAYQAQKTEYRGEATVCNACPLKAQCTPSDHGRQLHRHFAEAYLDRVRGYHQTHAYAKAMRKRQVWVEPLFAEGKQWHGMRRFHRRRWWRVNSEALLLASGQNLKRLLQRRGWEELGRRPTDVELQLQLRVLAKALAALDRPQPPPQQPPAHLVRSHVEPAGRAVRRRSDGAAQRDGGITP